MALIRYFMYGLVWAIGYTLFHIYFPPFWMSGVKRAIDKFFINPLPNWWFIFPLIGLIMLLGLVI
ncbi:MAG: hypothetical protein ACFFDX_12635 [Candidatus Odinarchaeota archaeon]